MALSRIQLGDNINALPNVVKNLKGYWFDKNIPNFATAIRIIRDTLDAAEAQIKEDLYQNEIKKD